jgi:hypothetical protein
MTTETFIDELIDRTQNEIDQIHQQLDWLCSQNQEYSQDFDERTKRLMYKTGVLNGAIEIKKQLNYEEQRE